MARSLYTSPPLPLPSLSPPIIGHWSLWSTAFFYDFPQIYNTLPPPPHHTSATATISYNFNPAHLITILPTPLSASSHGPCKQCLLIVSYVSPSYAYFNSASSQITILQPPTPPPSFTFCAPSPPLSNFVQVNWNPFSIQSLPCSSLVSPSHPTHWPIC